MLWNGVGHHETVAAVRVPSRSAALVFNHLERSTVRGGAIDPTNGSVHDEMAFTARIGMDR
jgi:hypothetical protein